jgi:hypothetical protein
MADIQKLGANLKVKSFDFDPDATSATDIGWEDMRDFDCLLVSFVRTIGTSNVTLKVLANADSAGGGTDVTVSTKTVSAQPDAVGDQIFLEINAQEVTEAARAAGIEGVRYVSANMSFATATDEGVVTYIFGASHRPQKDLTADIVA